MDRRSNHKVSLVNLDKKTNTCIYNHIHIYIFHDKCALSEGQPIYLRYTKKKEYKLKIHVYTSQHAKH